MHICLYVEKTSQQQHYQGTWLWINLTSHHKNEKRKITHFLTTILSQHVTQSDIIYESSVDILLELSGVWISGEGGGGWGLEIGVNEIL